jgi:hypothetical protein
MSRLRVVALSLILVFLPILSACSVPSLATKTIEINPVLIQQDSSDSHGYNAAFYCSYDDGLALTDPPLPGEAYIGVTRSYDDGICWEQIGERYRTLIYHDLTPLNGLKSVIIISADLYITERVVQWRDLDGEILRSGSTTSCMGTWTLAFTDPATREVTYSHDAVYTPEGRSEGNVFRITRLISGWVTGADEQTAIVLFGIDDNVASKDNGACLSAVSGFKLVVRYQSLPA